VQVLLNCAGIREYATLENVTTEQMLNSYRINAVGPLLTVQALLRHGLLQRGALVANVTSLVRLDLMVLPA
jgi:NAD(P)-dependent dehydrogenase (short-subunit alcohol dehydrogenase family)